MREEEKYIEDEEEREEKLTEMTSVVALILFIATNRNI